jgi:hypothetical protein
MCGHLQYQISNSFCCFKDSINTNPEYQFERLVAGTKRDLNGASSDLSAFPVGALPNPVSEPEKDPRSDTIVIVSLLMFLACREPVETRSGRCL